MDNRFPLTSANAAGKVRIKGPGGANSDQRDTPKVGPNQTIVLTHELVTLTGVGGGVGKTRLAIQVAAELVPDFAEGVWLVETATVGDPGSCAQESEG